MSQNNKSKNKSQKLQRGKLKKIEKIKSAEFCCCFEFISGMQEICVWTLLPMKSSLLTKFITFR